MDGIQSPFSIFIQSHENSLHLKREESLSVQHGGEAVSARSHADRFSMLISIHLAHRIKAFLELFAICGETNNGEDEAIFQADAKDFAIITGVYGIATGRASVAGHYGEVTAADA